MENKLQLPQVNVPKDCFSAIRKGEIAIGEQVGKFNCFVPVVLKYNTAGVKRRDVQGQQRLIKRLTSKEMVNRVAAKGSVIEKDEEKEECLCDFACTRNKWLMMERQSLQPPVSGIQNTPANHPDHNSNGFALDPINRGQGALLARKDSYGISEIEIIESEVNGDLKDVMVTRTALDKPAEIKELDPQLMQNGSKQKQRCFNGVEESEPGIIVGHDEIESSVTKGLAVEDPDSGTPIEKEIRRSLQREASLRRRRGIMNHIEKLVAIRTRPIFPPTLEIRNQQQHPGDFESKRLASQRMERDVRQENERGRNFVRVCNMPNHDDRSPPCEVGERCRAFERRMVTTEQVVKPRPRVKNPQNISGDEVVTGATNAYSISAAGGESDLDTVVIWEHGVYPLRTGPVGPITSTPQKPPEVCENPDTELMVIVESPGLKQLAMAPPQVPISPSVSRKSSGTVDPDASPLTLIEEEVREVQRREDELQRQRRSIYGRIHSEAMAQQKSKADCLEYTRKRSGTTPSSAVSHSRGNGKTGLSTGKGNPSSIGLSSVPSQNFDKTLGGSRKHSLAQQ
uniref:uncharacterized protein isoform X1 n=2 Tax=Myxine glutinosa TaxID=7769 RepID=UPI00358F5903